MVGKYKGWEPTFLIGAICLSEELSIRIGFAFCNNGLKSKDLRFGMKINYMVFLIMFYDFRLGLGIVTTLDTWHTIFLNVCLSQKIAFLSKHYTMLTQLYSFSMWKRHLGHLNVKCLVTIPRKIWNINYKTKTIYIFSHSKS